jgi:putative MATE family efflux protein
MEKIWQIFREALRGEEKNYTSGSINRAIVLLSIPMILEMVMESLFALVDAFFVAKVSVDAVATVGLTESVVTLVYSVAMGLSMAATAMVARRIGEGKQEEASHAAAQAIFLAMATSAVFGIAGIFFAEDILRLMGGSESLIASGAGYTRIMLGTNIVITFLFLLNGIFRGAGDASLAMRSLWLANGINIVLDPLLIFGIGPFPEMGVQGAAVATVIGRGIGVAFQLYILFKGSGVIKLARRHFRLQWEIIARLSNVAATGAGQFLIASASWIFLMRIIALFGSQAVAGYTIAIRLLIFTILPSWGLANAAATLVGQNLGAGKPDRAETSVWRSAYYNMIFLLSVSVIYFAAAHPLLMFFNDDPVVIEAGVLSIRIICTGYIFFAYGMVLSQAFNGAGDTRTPTIVNLICFWMLEIPLGYILAVSLQWELAGVCAAIAISETVMAIMLIFIFRRGTWKTVEI